MADRPRNILICSCEDTMPLDADAVRRGCRGAQVTTARHLCRAEIERFRTAARRGEPLIVGCTQEAPLFSEVADERQMTFVNLRETAGWSTQAAQAGPKMAALIAAAAEPAPEYSAGVAVERRRHADLRPRRTARSKPPNLLADHLDITVLISRAGQPLAAARRRLSDRQGHDQIRQGPSRRVRTCGRRLCRTGAVVARRVAVLARRATARCRAATSFSIFPAARRCFPRPICATAICAPIPAIPPPCSGRAEGARSDRHFRQAALHHFHATICARIRARRSSAAIAASISARPARSRRPAIMSRSTPISARAAASARPSARPAPRPMRCRRPTR